MSKSKKNNIILPILIIIFVIVIIVVGIYLLISSNEQLTRMVRGPTKTRQDQSATDKNQSTTDKDQSTTDKDQSATDKDQSATDKYNYAFSGTPYQVAEGEDVTITIIRTKRNSDEKSIRSFVYLTTTEATAFQKDYVPITEPKKIIFEPGESQKEITISTVADLELTELDERFYVNLYRTKKEVEDGAYFEYATVVIKNNITPLSTTDKDQSATDKDQSATDKYNYAFSGTPYQVAEGEDVTITIIRTKENSDEKSIRSIVYLNTSEATAFKKDYVPITDTEPKKIIFEPGESQKEITISTVADSELTESDERFFVNLYRTKKDVEDGDYFEYATVVIKNYIDPLSITNYNYTMQPDKNAAAANPVEKGKDATITITRTKINSNEKDLQSIVYIRVPGEDYIGQSLKEISFGPTETTKVIRIKTFADWKVEGKEFFYVELSKYNADDYEYTDWTKVYIKDKKEAKQGKGVNEKCNQKETQKEKKCHEGLYCKPTNELEGKGTCQKREKKT